LSRATPNLAPLYGMTRLYVVQTQNGFKTATTRHSSGILTPKATIRHETQRPWEKDGKKNYRPE
jgi:hypothetical protein